MVPVQRKQNIFLFVRNFVARRSVAMGSSCYINRSCRVDSTVTTLQMAPTGRWCPFLCIHSPFHLCIVPFFDCFILPVNGFSLSSFPFISLLPSSLKSRDSSVGVALGYGLDDRGSRVRFPAGAGNFSLHHRVQNDSGAHTASYPVGTRGSFPGYKAAGAWSWHLTSI
jgi:hypothetical protein